MACPCSSTNISLVPQVVGVTASPCVGKEALAGAVRGSSTTATVKAVSSLAAAFRLVQIEKCSQGVRCLQALRHDLHQGQRGKIMMDANNTMK